MYLLHDKIFSAIPHQKNNWARNIVIIAGKTIENIAEAKYEIRQKSREYSHLMPICDRNVTLYPFP